MARINSEYLQQYPVMKFQELKQPIVFVVDMINGFIKEGALHDQAILACVDAILALIKQAENTIFIADSHDEQAREFTSYPKHCLKNTRESEIVDELLPFVHTKYLKNSTNTFFAKDFQASLANYRNCDLILTGCCTDLCILQFALSLNAWLNEHNILDVRVIVPIDTVDTYHIEGIHDAQNANVFALANMAMNGIHVVAHVESEDNLCKD